MAESRTASSNERCFSCSRMKWSVSSWKSIDWTSARLSIDGLELLQQRK